MFLTIANKSRFLHRLLACLVVVGGSSLGLCGCGEPSPEAGLPAEQAAAAKALQQAGAKTVVRDGRLAYVDFYGTDAAAAAKLLAPLKQVEEINFASTNLTDEALAHVAELVELKKLALNRTQVTDKGLAHLARLTRLEILNFNEDSVTDAGLVHLAAMSELKQLHLNKTAVTDAGLKHLDGLRKLEMVLAFGTPVTSAGADAFREGHPGAEITISDVAEGEQSQE